MNKKELEICKFEMHLKNFFICTLRPSLKTGIWISEIRSENRCGK